MNKRSLFIEIFHIIFMHHQSVIFFDNVYSFQKKIIVKKPFKKLNLIVKGLMPRAEDKVEELYIIP